MSIYAKNDKLHDKIFCYTETTSMVLVILKSRHTCHLKKLFHNYVNIIEMNGIFNLKIDILIKYITIIIIKFIVIITYFHLMAKVKLKTKNGTSIDPVLTRTSSTLAMAFIWGFWCFSKTEPATATLGNHRSSRLTCTLLQVIGKEKKIGDLFFYSSHTG